MWLLFLAALGVWTWQVFEFGRQRGGYDAAEQVRVVERLQRRVDELERERADLRAAAARFERAGQIDRAAADGVKSEVRALQAERADLKREVAFLKSLVSGEDVVEAEELQLDEPSLVEVGDRAFRFEVTLSKRSQNTRTVIGQVLVSVSGVLDGEDKVLGLEALTAGARTNFGIKFKNFQRLKTDLQLPDGFEPASIRVAVKPDGKSFKSFEQAYDWKPSDA